MTAVVYYDAHCRLCQASVRFIRNRDRRNRFQFAPLQSEAGRQVAAAAGLDSDPPGSVVLRVDDSVFVRSAAALRIVMRLRFPWPLLALGWIIPRPIRDALYDGVARHRYRWFGRVGGS